MSLNLIPPVTVFNNVDISVNQISAPIHVQYSDNIGIQFVWTGTPTGTFGVNVSNTANLGANGLITGGTWTPLVLTAPNNPAAVGAAGNGFIDLNQIGAAFVQVTYTAASGSGNCTAVLTAKPV